MVGGLGFGCSGNIGDKLAVFRAYARLRAEICRDVKVNPIATILAAKMMLEWLGEKEKAGRLEGAVAEVIREARCAPTTWRQGLDDRHGPRHLC